jgi:hypothetical protein
MSSRTSWEEVKTSQKHSMTLGNNSGENLKMYQMEKVCQWMHFKTGNDGGWKVLKWRLSEEQ